MALPVPKLPVPVPNLVFLAMYDGLGAVLVQVIVIFQVSISNRSRRFWFPSVPVSTGLVNWWLY